MGQRPGSAGGHLPQSLPFLVEPSLEVRAVGEKNPIKEITSIELQSLLDPPVLHGFLEGEDVTPNLLLVQAYFPRPPIQNDLPPHGLSEVMKGASEGASSVLLVLLRREHAHQLVSPVEPSRTSYSQVCQECGALWLGEDREDLFTSGSPEIQ